MGRTVLALFIIVCSQVSSAALPPQYQNMRDFDVMVEFINSHERVLSTLKLIDFEQHIIYFDGDCRALFGREFSIKLMGWVGPADPLEFKRSTCDLEE